MIATTNFECRSNYWTLLQNTPIEKGNRMLPTYFLCTYVYQFFRFFFFQLNSQHLVCKLKKLAITCTFAQTCKIYVIFVEEEGKTKNTDNELKMKCVERLTVTCTQLVQKQKPEVNASWYQQTLPARTYAITDSNLRSWARVCACVCVRVCAYVNSNNTMYKHITYIHSKDYIGKLE